MFLKNVLDPVLFSNDLPAPLPSSVSCSFYAEDLAIWSFSYSAPAAVETTQRPLIRLEGWSEDWCLSLNSSKCEGSYSVDPIKLSSSSIVTCSIPFSFLIPLTTFFGITFYCTLSFSKHVSSLKAKFFPRLKALRSFCTSSRGLSKELLSFLGKAFRRPLLTYASPDGFLFLALPNGKRLHGAASSVITGCLMLF